VLEQDQAAARFGQFIRGASLVLREVELVARTRITHPNPDRLPGRAIAGLKARALIGPAAAAVSR